MLVLTGEVVLVLEAACLKTFQVRFVVLHRLRLSPWAYAFSPLTDHAASLLRLNLSFPSAFVDFLFLCGDFERSLMRPCGSTAADSSSVKTGTRTGARSRERDLCRLPEPPESSSGTVNGSWITIGCIGDTGGVCGAGTGGVCGAGIGGVCGACAEVPVPNLLIT